MARLQRMSITLCIVLHQTPSATTCISTTLRTSSKPLIGYNMTMCHKTRLNAMVSPTHMQNCHTSSSTQKLGAITHHVLHMRLHTALCATTYCTTARSTNNVSIRNLPGVMPVCSCKASTSVSSNGLESYAVDQTTRLLNDLHEMHNVQLCWCNANDCCMLRGCPDTAFMQ
jgi:hypothetical protein